jgi:hypothetical protein
MKNYPFLTFIYVFLILATAFAPSTPIRKYFEVSGTIFIFISVFLLQKSKNFLIVIFLLLTFFTFFYGWIFSEEKSFFPGFMCIASFFLAATYFSEIFSIFIKKRG